MKGAYAKLIRVSETRQAQARRVCMAPRGGSEGAAQRLVRQFETFPPRNDRAITQTVRRVIDGEVVSAKEKIASLFEPHTQIILRHKVGKAVEFGRKLWVEEVEGGIISGYRVLEEPGQDDAYFARRLTAHQRRFGKAPHLVAGDWGSPRPRMSAWPPRWKSSELCCASLGWQRIAGAARARMGAVVSARLSVSGQDRRVDQRLAAPLWARALSGSRPGRDGTLHRLGYPHPQPGQDRPSAGRSVGSEGSGQASRTARAMLLSVKSCAYHFAPKARTSHQSSKFRIQQRHLALQEPTTITFRSLFPLQARHSSDTLEPLQSRSPGVTSEVRWNADAVARL